jgi:hypothetical protein
MDENASPPAGFEVGSRLAFANAFLTVNGERIVRANAVFSHGSGPLPERTNK